MHTRRKLTLWAEVIVFFFGIPSILYLFPVRGVVIALLWLGALIGVQVLRRDPSYNYRADWNHAGLKSGLRDVLRRFAILVPLLFAFTVVHDPDHLFFFPLERPGMWLVVMLLYPLLSVWPQEILYRSVFIRRYQPLFAKPRSIAIASALAFGYVHILFNNWIAIVFCTVGGWMFASTYQRHRSLGLVCLEHALYGCLIFTVGLGWYFYGAAWKR